MLSKQPIRRPPDRTPGPQRPFYQKVKQLVIIVCAPPSPKPPKQPGKYWLELLALLLKVLTAAIALSKLLPHGW